MQTSIELTLKQEAMEIMEKELAKVWVRAHGEIAAASAPNTPHTLANALRAYRDKNGAFPRGTRGPRARNAYVEYSVQLPHAEGAL